MSGLNNIKFEKIVYNVWDLLLRPEQCSICKEYMSVVYQTNGIHDKLERLCACSGETNVQKKTK
ncbi:hypothetical protein [Microviridae sp.]|nr:hypothetical protein [Microviridae sp.]